MVERGALCAWEPNRSISARRSTETLPIPPVVLHGACGCKLPCYSRNSPDSSEKAESSGIDPRARVAAARRERGQTVRDNRGKIDSSELLDRYCSDTAAERIGFRENCGKWTHLLELSRSPRFFMSRHNLCGGYNLAGCALRQRVSKRRGRAESANLELASTVSRAACTAVILASSMTAPPRAQRQARLCQQRANPPQVPRPDQSRPCRQAQGAAESRAGISQENPVCVPTSNLLALVQNADELEAGSRYFACFCRIAPVSGLPLAP